MQISSLHSLTLAAFLLLGACQPKSSGQSPDAPAQDSIPAEEVRKPLPFDTLLTETARFIAGLDAPHYLSALQEKPFYATHREFTDKSWKTTTDSMILPIGNWRRQQMEPSPRAELQEKASFTDSLLCFYPLSGPDFLFAHAFFPNADNFVMLGLEPRGSLTDFRNLKDADLEKYLSGVRQSMKYLNTRGYFVTSHMGSDFSRHHLNGMVHMMLYMMARTGHPIVDVYEVTIDAQGKEHRLAKGAKTSENLVAVKIDFLSPDTLKQRSAYYFRLDASDANLQKNPGFAKFVNAFPHRASYMKSASCVLQNPNFDIMRELVIQSDQILQDDTGLPYRYFTADTTLSVKLYGTYTSTIKDLSWCYQPALRKALEKSPHYGKLPFRISYNGNYGEGMLIYGVRKPKE